MPGEGINTFVTAYTESTYGTNPGSGGVTSRIVSATLRRLSSQTAGDRGLGKVAAKCVRNRLKRAAGDLVFDMHYEGLERFLLHFFGAVSTSGAGADKTHVFAPSLARQVGLSLDLDLDTSKAKLVGQKVNRLQFAISNEILRLTFGLIGKPGTEASSTTGSGYTTSPCVLPLETTNGLSALLDGSPISLSSAEVTLEWPHSEDREFLGDENLQEPRVNDLLAVSGQIVREYDNTDLVDSWLANSQHTLEFNYESDTVIPTTATEYAAKLKLYNVMFTEALPPVEGAGVLVETVPFVAFLDASDDIVDFTLINGTASVS